MSCAKKRGHQHVIIYYSDKEPTQFESFENTKSDHVTCRSLGDLEKAFALIQIPADQIITIPCSPQTKEAQHSIQDAINAGKWTRFENTRTVSKFGKPWATNVIKNLPSLSNALNLHQLNVDGVRDAVIVASGPHSTKMFRYLKKFKTQFLLLQRCAHFLF